MYDVITIGSATIDAFVDTDDKLFKATHHKFGKCVFVPFGSKIVVDDLKFLTGGGGTNTAVSFSRLGLKTAMIGKFGGESSNIIFDELKRENVDTSLIVKADSVGFSVVLDAKGCDRTILTHKGANDMLTLNEVELSKLDTKWFYMASMVGKSFETMLKIAEYAENKGIKIAFNPSSYIAKQGFKKLKGVLSYTDALILNKEEAGELLGKEYSIDTALQKLREITQDIVVITDGANGSHCLADGKHYHIKHKPVKAIETTGAGDSFASAFVAGIIMGKPIDYCLKMGQANAISVIMHPGAKNILLTMPQMEEAIKKMPVKITIQKI